MFCHLSIECYRLLLTGLQQLSANPLVVTIQRVDGIYILQYNRRSRRVTCSCNVSGGRICSHKKEYLQWRNQGNGEEGEDELHILNPSTSTTFDSVSKDSIPYPLPADLQQVNFANNTLCWSVILGYVCEGLCIKKSKVNQ